MLSQSPHPNITQVVQNIRSIAHCQKQSKCGLWGTSQLPCTKRPVSIPAGERNSSQGGSSVASTIQGQNSTPSSSLNISRVADSTEYMSFTLFATQQRSIQTPTVTPGTSSGSTPPLVGTSQTDSAHRLVFSPVFSIASTHTPLRALENLYTTIPNPEAHTMITNPLQMWATERNQRQR